MTAVAVAVFAIAYVLDRHREDLARSRPPSAARRSWSALGIVGAEDVFYSHETGIDWDVIFLLFGMMIIVGVLRQTGVFEYTRSGRPSGPAARHCG